MGGSQTEQSPFRGLTGNFKKLLQSKRGSTNSKMHLNTKGVVTLSLILSLALLGGASAEWTCDVEEEATCGDDVCDPSENSTNCWEDCGSVCGDGIGNGRECVGNILTNPNYCFEDCIDRNATPGNGPPKYYGPTGVLSQRQFEQEDYWGNIVRMSPIEYNPYSIYKMSPSSIRYQIKKLTGMNFTAWLKSVRGW